MDAYDAHSNPYASAGAMTPGMSGGARRKKRAGAGKKRKTTTKKTKTSAAAGRKIHVGPQGGKYYVKNGAKHYL
jgi:hypothetical protein